MVKMTNESQREMSSSLEFYLFCDGPNEHDRGRSAQWMSEIVFQMGQNMYTDTMFYYIINEKSSR